MNSEPRARGDLNAILDRLVVAAGGNVVHGAIGIEVVRPITDLQAMGCDLELDIIPAVSETVPKMDAPLRTWGAGFLRDAALARQAARLRGRGTQPTAKEFNPHAKDETMWRRWWEAWKRLGFWHVDWGPKPDDEREPCRIPAELRERWSKEAA